MYDRRGTRALCFVATGLLLVCASQAGLPQSAGHKLKLGRETAASVFGQRESVVHASLSPDGTKLATVQANGSRGTALVILDLADPAAQPKAIVAASGEPERVSWCRWVSNSRLLCQVWQVQRLQPVDMIANVSRLTAIDVDGGNVQFLQPPSRNGRAWGFSTYGGSVLDWDAGKEGQILISSWYIPEFATGTRISNAAEGMAVDLIDTRNLKRVPVESAKVMARHYLTDGHGRVRIMGIDQGTDYDSGVLRYSFRKKTGDAWHELGSLNAAQRDGFAPEYVDRNLDVVYGMKTVDGRLAAYSIALDGSGTERRLLARTDVDVDGFVTIGRNRRVIGISYTTDRNQVTYLDPKLEAIVGALSKAMPHLPLIRLVDASEDEKKLLIWASSDVDPGRYYVLDRATNAMEEVAVNRLPLEQVALASVKPVSFPAADGTIIPGYLTLPPGSDGKNLPSIVLPHGGPSARDQWGFDWLAQYWAHLGYAVLQPNFRGSSGFGDDWLQKNGIQSWKTAVGDVTDAGRWLVTQGIADPQKLGIFGWSYGGYAALQAGAIAPGLFRAIVAVAPVTDFETLRQDGENWSSYRVTSAFIGTGPHIREGSPAQRAGEIRSPVLLFHGDLDRNVDIGHSRLMAERLKAASKDHELITYAGLDHYLDDSNTRKDMLLRSASFMDKAFAAP